MPPQAVHCRLEKEKTLLQKLSDPALPSNSDRHHLQVPRVKEQGTSMAIASVVYNSCLQQHVSQEIPELALVYLCLHAFDRFAGTILSNCFQPPTHLRAVNSLG